MPKGEMPAVDWVAAYASTRAAVAELARALPADCADTMVPACPAWTVRDVLAHVTGLAVALGDGDLPVGDNQAWIDRLVAARRGSTLAALADEWVGAAPRTDAFVARMGAGASQLVYDAVAHEHDIRHATGRAGARDEDRVHACAVAMSRLLERDLATAGLPGVRLTSAGRHWQVGAGEPALAIELDPFELIRVFGARRSEGQLRMLAWQGDLDRYLPALRHFPLPATDLLE
jgi:uncharacterized protein (TIGR03083 family)